MSPRVPPTGRVDKRCLLNNEDPQRMDASMLLSHDDNMQGSNASSPPGGVLLLSEDTSITSSSWFGTGNGDPPSPLDSSDEGGVSLSIHNLSFSDNDAMEVLHSRSPIENRTQMGVSLAPKSVAVATTTTILPKSMAMPESSMLGAIDQNTSEKNDNSIRNDTIPILSPSSFLQLSTVYPERSKTSDDNTTTATTIPNITPANCPVASMSDTIIKSKNQDHTTTLCYRVDEGKENRNKSKEKRDIEKGGKEEEEEKEISFLPNPKLDQDPIRIYSLDNHTHKERKILYLLHKNITPALDWLPSCTEENLDCYVTHAIFIATGGLGAHGVLVLLCGGDENVVDRRFLLPPSRLRSRRHISCTSRHSKHESDLGYQHVHISRDNRNREVQLCTQVTGTIAGVAPREGTLAQLDGLVRLGVGWKRRVVPGKVTDRIWRDACAAHTEEDVRDVGNLAGQTYLRLLRG